MQETTIPEHNFSILFEQSPPFIEQMPGIFTSHEFILRLPHQHQVIYIEALYSYHDSMHRGKPAPFKDVHQTLSQHLDAYPDLVTRMGDVQSIEILEQSGIYTVWKEH